MRFGELIPLIGALLNFFARALRPFSKSARRGLAGLFPPRRVLRRLELRHLLDVPRAERTRTRLFWARFLQFGVIFIPLALCHISFLIARFAMPKRGSSGSLYALHVVLFLSNFTGFLSGRGQERRLRVVFGRRDRILDSERRLFADVGLGRRAHLASAQTAAARASAASRR